MNSNHVYVRAPLIPGKGDTSAIVNGVDVTDYIRGIDIRTQGGQVNEVALHLVRPSIELELDAVVYAVAPESDAGVLRRAANFLEGIDPARLEEQALENMGLGNSNITENILSVLKGVLRDAADQLEADPEVPGTADDGSVEDLSSSRNGNEPVG